MPAMALTFISEVKRFLIILHWLNVDTAIGSVITSLFIAKTLSLSAPSVAFCALGLSVLAIYNFDHMIDAGKLSVEAISARHKFYQNNRKQLAAYQLLIMLALMVIICFMPLAIIKAGAVLGVFSLIYFLLLFLVFSGRFLLKEVFIAILFTVGLVVPFAGQPSPYSDQAFILLSAQIFLLAFSNLLVFSWYEHEMDSTEKHPSLARELGKRTTYWLTIILLLVLLLSLYLESPMHILIPAILISIMGSVLLMCLLFNKILRKAELYRIIGDAIFMIPLLAFL